MRQAGKCSEQRKSMFASPDKTKSSLLHHSFSVEFLTKIGLISIKEACNEAADGMLVFMIHRINAICSSTQKSTSYSPCFVLVSKTPVLDLYGVGPYPKVETKLW